VASSNVDPYLVAIFDNADVVGDDPDPYLIWVIVSGFVIFGIPSTEGREPDNPEFATLQNATVFTREGKRETPKLRINLALVGAWGIGSITLS
jgi:hypothetical protein